ncbi:hypothetical protein [Allocoleopsis sp.]|uniref:hypothetical protein n=1 Tax=Allocoleopsis sp. TaxID=3088169 RepID=UPI002FD41CAF
MQFSTVLVGLQVGIRLKTSEKSQSFEGGNNLFQDRAIRVLERDILALQGKKVQSLYLSRTEESC